MFKQNFTYLIFVSIASCPFTGHHCEGAGFVFFTSPIRYLYTLISSLLELSLLQASSTM